MAVPLSVEGRIETGLRENCINARQFVDIAKALHVQIGRGTFSEALNGKRSLDRETGEKLMGVLSELKLLRATFPDIPIDWGVTKQVATLVTIMRVEKIGSKNYVFHSRFSAVLIELLASSTNILSDISRSYCSNSLSCLLFIFSLPLHCLDHPACGLSVQLRRDLHRKITHDQALLNALRTGELEILELKDPIDESVIGVGKPHEVFSAVQQS